MFEELSPTDYLNEAAADELWQLLDVREPWELDVARIDGALTIPMAELQDRIDELDTTRPVAVLCHSGGRSARVAAYLVQCGFPRVANIEGGIDAWAIEADTSLSRY